MCLAVPARVIAIEDELATVEVRGATRKASLMLLPEARVGDYVLVHAGFAMQVVTENDAAETEALWAEKNGAARTVNDIETLNDDERRAIHEKRL